MKHALRLAGLLLAVALTLGATVAVRKSAAVPVGPAASAGQNANLDTSANGADAQTAHAKGTCGTLGPGTGLIGGKGWVLSMLPGLHEFRARNGGSVFVTVAKKTALEFDAGRPYYIVVEGATPGTVLEWKTPKSDWAAVPKTFLYPPQNVTY